ncbi:GNAT family N-acetyltransferase [Halomonas stenophila]|uniref:Ribosomal protein S18 acetylase RimI-like enzyme n=1 Tax=Halomonas stenophila TaxID=795312 RepID=A0A7W5ERJ8_9GAMM|nr:GNAT family N-acetyltransferase [Halomonas stenophila]MBB3230177.1 ribosomal protein S18 acetylase RimI-like enzyme [Halomonas stenophila]
MSQGVVTYQVAGDEAASPEERRLAASSPSFLRPLLGRAYQRRRLLAGGVNWQRILFVAVDGEVAGYLQFYLRGEGPHRLSLAELRAEFGASNAAWRWALYQLVQWRFRRFEAYLYRIIIDERFRSRGLGRRLLERWLELLAQHEVRQADLEVWGNNPRAEAFYASLGYEAYRRRRWPLRASWLRDRELTHMVKRW